MPDITSFSAEYPFLLFPVQVQVKFVRNSAQFISEHPDTRTEFELRIRIYPDQIGLNTHETELTTEEIQAAQTYWSTSSQQGEPHSIGAWRTLVNRYGAARAQWIVRQTKPTNLDQLSGLPDATLDFPEVETHPASWSKPATSLIMPSYFTAILYRQHTDAVAVTDPYLQSQLMGHLKQPYSTIHFQEATTEFLQLYKQVDGASIAAGPLQVGIDPQQNTSGLNEAGELAWMVDFEQALMQGLAIAVPLTTEEFEQGFKRLIVLGVRDNATVGANTTLLHELFTNHLYTTGLELVPQGTPTNNTQGNDSGFSSEEQTDAEVSFKTLTRAPLFTPQPANDLLHHTDGQRFTDALGLTAAAFGSVLHTNRYDGREARLMNRALWPATYGYFLEEMMRPAFSKEDIAWTRDFFQNHVSGRGAVPAFRVGNEPYGILPTTHFSAWSALDVFSQKLVEVLRHLDVTWTERLNEAGDYPALPGSGVDDSSASAKGFNLLTTLGSDATSVEYYQRYMLGPSVTDTLYHHGLSQQRNIWSREVENAGAPAPANQRQTGSFGTPAAQLNPLYGEFMQRLGGAALGLSSQQSPRIFEQSFQSSYQRIVHTFADVPLGPNSAMGGLIDDLPFSETNPVPFFAGTESNYIHWLATSSFDHIRREDFSNLYADGLPKDFAAPTSLLYRLLRHAVLLEYWHAAADTIGLTSEQRAEKELFNILAQDIARWELLYQPAGPGIALHEHLQTGAGVPGQQLVAYLAEVAALALVPTARLERVMAEHLDLGNHRIDAWKSALVARRLGELRQQNAQGNHLGAFAWLEDIQHEDNSKLLFASKPEEETNPGGDTLGVQPEEELLPPFLADSIGEVRKDPDNLGYIHSPSLNHAMTAAILRQGYKSRQLTVDKQDPAADRMAINLSSERVRKALAILEGIRAGQSLSALLGQEFEIGLGRYPDQVDNRPYAYYLQYFRQRYPFANEKKLVGQEIPAGEASVETKARQVVDGLALLQASTLPYPYSILELPSKQTSPAFATAVEQQIGALLDTLDALGDLTIGEGIYQSVMGNNEQAGAMMESIAKGKFPVTPEIVEPRSPGTALTHRVLIHLPQSTPLLLNSWGPNATPLARAAPELNAWLAGFFGDPNQIIFPYAGALLVTPDPGMARPGGGSTGSGDTGLITLRELNIQPVDLLNLLDAKALQAGSTLDVLLKHAIAPDAAWSDSLLIDYAGSGVERLRQLQPLASRLRQLIAGSRAALPKDLQTTASAGATQLATTGINEQQLIARFTDLMTTVQGLITALPATAKYAGDVLQRGELGSNAPAPSPHALRLLLRQAANFNVAEAVQALTAPTTIVLQSAVQVRAVLLKRLTEAEQALGKRWAAVAPQGEPSNNLELATDQQYSTLAPNEISAYTRAGEALFGASFRLTLGFTLPTEEPSLYVEAASRTGLLRYHAQNPLIMEEWLQGIAPVREPLDHLSKVMLINSLVWDEAEGHALPELQPLQLSVAATADDYWLGVSYPSAYEPAGDAVSLVQLLPPQYSATGQQCALWLDEWTEMLPQQEQTTAVAFHYDQPNSSAPQSLLLVVAPGSTWSFDHLLGAVNETLDMAKKRTVEPDRLALTHLGTVLPALVAPVAQQGVTFTLDFRQVNNTAKFREEAPGQRL